MKWREILTTAAIATVFATVASWAISPPFATSWTSAYEAIPADTEQESLGASRIRDLKFQLRLRLAQDHSWAGDGNDGYHNQVTLIQQSADPTPQLDQSKTAGIAYTKLVGSRDELFYKDSSGTVTQITNQGVLNIPVTASGTVAFMASATIPAGWDACDGTAHSRSGEAALFAAIGTTYGAGDGVSTFNVPDVRGRALFGFDSGNATGRLTLANTGGISAAALGNTGGQQGHALTIAEMAAHTHTATVNDPGHVHSFSNSVLTGNSGSTPGGGNPIINFITQTNSAVTGISVTNTSTGGGLTHNVVPPGIVFNCMIKQ